MDSPCITDTYIHLHGVRFRSFTKVAHCQLWVFVDTDCNDNRIFSLKHHYSLHQRNKLSPSWFRKPQIENSFRKCLAGKKLGKKIGWVHKTQSHLFWGRSPLSARRRINFQGLEKEEEPDRNRFKSGDFCTVGWRLFGVPNYKMTFMEWDDLPYMWNLRFCWITFLVLQFDWLLLPILQPTVQ